MLLVYSCNIQLSLVCKNLHYKWLGKKPPNNTVILVVILDCEFDFSRVQRRFVWAKRGTTNNVFNQLSKLKRHTYIKKPLFKYVWLFNGRQTIKG